MKDEAQGTARPASVEDLKLLLGALPTLFVVDLVFNACGENCQSLLPYALTIDFEGVPVTTLNPEGLLKTRQTSRDKDRLGWLILDAPWMPARKGEPQREPLRHCASPAQAGLAWLLARIL